MSAVPDRSTVRSPVAARVLARAVAGGFALLLAALLPAAGAAATDTPQVVEGDILTAAASGRRAIGTSRGSRLWPYGEVPYLVDGALGEAGRRAVRDAVARWNEISGITLVAIDAATRPPPDHVVFQPGDGCASWVGRQGGPQAIWVGGDCTAGSVMHEIGHALGLEHEHTRPDRDAHVRVNWERIVPEKRHNFDTAPPDTRFLGDYDLESIMHYGGYNFSSDGGATLEPLDPVAGARMGQRESPSAGDVAAVAQLYASDLSLAVQTDDERAAREVTLFVTNEHQQGAHALELTLEAPGLAIVGGDEGWRCGIGAERARCTLARLGGEARTQVTFALAAPLDALDLVAGLDSKTPDADPADNGERGTGEPTFAAALGRPAGEIFADVPDGGGGDEVALDGAFSLAEGGGGALSWWLALVAGLLVAGRASDRSRAY